MQRPGKVPEVSVIMPTYNRADYIVEAIASVKDQTFQDLELIIVDDGSTDETNDLIKPYLDDRCFYHKMKHEGNISRLRNFGIQNSRADLIAYIDSDDVWAVTKIQTQVDVLTKHPEIGLVFTKVKTFNAITGTPDLETTSSFKSLEISFRDILFNKFSVYPSSILYRRTCLSAAGIHDVAFRWNDLGFITRIVAHGRGAFIDGELTGIRKHGDNISTVIRTEAVGFRDMIHTTELLCDQGLISIDEKKKITFDFLQRMGTMLHQEGKFSDATATYKKALQINPASVKVHIKFALSTFQALFSR